MEIFAVSLENIKIQSNKFLKLNDFNQTFVILSNNNFTVRYTFTYTIGNFSLTLGSFRSMNLIDSTMAVRKTIEIFYSCSSGKLDKSIKFINANTFKSVRSLFLVGYQT